MQENYSVQDLNKPTNSIEKFAKNVFDKLIMEGIPPVPSNYGLYFFNMLEDESDELKKQVQDALSMEETHDIEKDLEVEKKLKNSFKYLKEILQKTAVIYKLTNQLKKISDESLNQFQHIVSQKIMEKYLKLFEEKIDSISCKMDKELNSIKEVYAKNIELIKDIESNSVFDMRYGVYNEKYFKKELNTEINLMKKFKYISSLIFIKINDNVIKQFKSPKSIVILNKSIAKILLKTSRRTDIVAHIGNGVFAMLLKHTDRIGAIKTIERFSSIIAYSTVFVEGEEAKIKIVGAICELGNNKEYEDYLHECNSLLFKAQEKNLLYIEGER